MSKLEIQIAKNVNRILYTVWDPIGVSKPGEPDDEYVGYVSHIMKLLDEGASETEIAEHLKWIAKEHIGVEAPAALSEAAAHEIVATCRA